MTDSPLAAQFHQAMLETYQEAAQVGYRPTRFLQMVNELGGVATARFILAQEHAGDGFTTLWEKQRLDLAVEALVLKPAFAALFSPEERARARARLAAANYVAPWDRPDAAPPAAQPAPSLVDRLARAVQNTQGGGAPPDESPDDEDPGEDKPLDRLDAWQADIETASPFVRFFAEEYPNWLTATFGRSVTFLPYTGQRFSVYLNGQRIQWGRLRKRSGVFITLPTVREPADREHVQTLGPQLALGLSRGGTNFALENDADYAALQAIMRWIGGLPPGEPLDDPTFVVIHKSDYDAQAYGRSYQFSNRASGDSRKLIDALETFADGGPPVRLIIYRPGPHYAFTAWATSAGVTRRAGADPAERIYVVDLEQHEFTPPLLLRGAAADLTKRLSWLSDGLQAAFNFRAIRRIPAADFTTILAAAEAPMTRPLTIAEAAFTVLSRAGGGPLHLSEVLRRIQAENLANLGGQTPQLTLASIMLRDERFQNLGRNTWVLANIGSDAAATDRRADLDDALPEPPTRTPLIVADAEARFWRIHLPRELWARARSAGVIAIGGALDSTNLSVKRFQQIAVGDRIVAYVQGGTIGGIGIVVRAFDPAQPRLGLPAATLGDEFTQYLRVAWADAPVEPADLLAPLRHPRYTDLYNRLKSPPIVVPLDRADYTALLSLLMVDDPGLPQSVSRLPQIWAQLADYVALAQALGERTVAAAELLATARTLDPPPNEPLDAADLTAALLQLRLIAADGAGYRARPYVAGERAALLRLCALALLVLVEGADDQYSLPARAVLPRLRAATEAAPAGKFAPELGEADSTTLAGWYAEAGLIAIDDDAWQPVPEALAPLPGADAATTAYNTFLAALQATVDGAQPGDLPHVAADAPLPEVADFTERLRELGHDLLFDTAIVRRIYRSLLAGRHVVLSGPPGTGKTELARRLPGLLWREAPQTFYRLTLSPEAPPVEAATEQRHGYAPLVVTATEDWGVRDVVGGIGPKLDGAGGGLSYAIEHGALTRTALRHYDDTSDGNRLPPGMHFTRRDHRHEGRRYRGAWLVIDEFTRAPIDAAFGSLLTTLSGNEQARLAVPTSGGDVMVPLPRDFRIIGTLNSFDRHFLNQISEAMKRRFDFIDVLPPPPSYARFEQGIALKEALRRIRDSGFTTITAAGTPPVYAWPGLLRVEPVRDDDGLQRYLVHPEDPAAEAALDAFWRLFSAVRVFRQLGTAQAIAVYLNLLTGVRVGMEWGEALDTALADALADQMQVLNRDEQRTIDALVEHAGNPATFVSAVQSIVRELPPGRRVGYLYALRERDAANGAGSDILVRENADLTADQITRVFAVDTPLGLPEPSVFRRRLRDLIGERGL
jgi:hypothetical protein